MNEFKQAREEYESTPIPEELDVSPTFAAAAADVPVLGGLFQVLTVRNYETVKDGIDYDVSVPEVEADGAVTEAVNAEIQERVDAHLAQAKADWDAYKEAFFATGGTEEQWGDREMDVIIDYDIKSQTDTTVSFVVDFAECWVAAQQQRYCYNLDTANDKDITLADRCPGLYRPGHLRAVLHPGPGRLHHGG